MLEVIGNAKVVKFHESFWLGAGPRGTRYQNILTRVSGRHTVLLQTDVSSKHMGHQTPNPDVLWGNS